MARNVNSSPADISDSNQEDGVAEAMGALALHQDNETVKSQLRQDVWDYMESHNLMLEYPRPCHDRIPNFVGNRRAAERLSRLREFRTAQCIKVNPSLAQMHLRFLILKEGKTLLVPNPALSDLNFFYRIDGSHLGSIGRCKRASTKAGSVALGSPLQLDWTGIHIDIAVVASVVVCPETGARLGKGKGYAELEWGMLTELGAVDDRTVVMTTVHEVQLATKKEFPASVLKEHDLPVDVIVTPSRVFNVKRKLAKPKCGVLWELVSPKMLEEIPILRQLKEAKKVSPRSRMSNSKVDEED